MDAFLKCLLACVMSLMPTGINAHSSHLISDQQAINRFTADRDRFQDLVLDMLIAERPPHVLQRDSKVPAQTRMHNYAAINEEMHNLGIQKITRDGNRITFRVAETEIAAKDLVFLPYGFSAFGTREDSERCKVSKIDDDWGLASVSKSD